jgi:hypothetical protein
MMPASVTAVPGHDLQDCDAYADATLFFLNKRKLSVPGLADMLHRRGYRLPGGRILKQHNLHSYLTVREPGKLASSSTKDRGYRGWPGNLMPAIAEVLEVTFSDFVNKVDNADIEFQFGSHSPRAITRTLNRIHESESRSVAFMRQIPKILLPPRHRGHAIKSELGEPDPQKRRKGVRDYQEFVRSRSQLFYSGNLELVIFMLASDLRRSILSTKGASNLGGEHPIHLVEHLHDCVQTHGLELKLLDERNASPDLHSHLSLDMCVLVGGGVCLSRTRGNELLRYTTNPIAVERRQRFFGTLDQHDVLDTDRVLSELWDSANHMDYSKSQ